MRSRRTSLKVRDAWSSTEAASTSVAVDSKACGAGRTSTVGSVEYRATIDSSSAGTILTCALRRSKRIPSSRARMDASTTTPWDKLGARPLRATSTEDLDGRAACGRTSSRSVDHVCTAVGARLTVFVQPLRRTFGRRHDLSISLTPCLTAEDVPEAEHRETADPHVSLFRRSDDTAALAAVTVTTPVSAAAPVLTVGLLYATAVAFPTTRCHLLLRRNIFTSRPYLVEVRVRACAREAVRIARTSWLLGIRDAPLIANGSATSRSSAFV